MGKCPVARASPFLLSQASRRGPLVKAGEALSGRLAWAT